MSLGLRRRLACAYPSPTALLRQGRASSLPDHGGGGQLYGNGRTELERMASGCEGHVFGADAKNIKSPACLFFYQSYAAP